jgi:hypothetical protein
MWIRAIAISGSGRGTRRDMIEASRGDIRCDDPFGAMVPAGQSVLFQLAQRPLNRPAMGFDEAPVATDKRLDAQ